MKPKSSGPEQDYLLRPRLTVMIDMRHELVKLRVVVSREWWKLIGGVISG